MHTDIQHIADKLGAIKSKLDAEFLKLQSEGAATEPEEQKEVKASEELTNEDSHQNTTVALIDDSGQNMDVEDGDEGHSARPFSDAHKESDLTSCSSDCYDLKRNEEDLAPSREEIHNQGCFSPHSEEEAAGKVEGKREKNAKWVIVG